MNNKLVIGISAAALASGLGLGLGQLASAETPSPTPSPAATASSPSADTDLDDPRPGPGRGGHGQGHRDGQPMNLADLATRLGVDEDELEDAFDDVRGTLNPPARPSSGSRPGVEERDAARAEREAAVAKALAEKLGLDAATVEEALSDMHEERHSERTAAAEGVLEQAVADGDLTQAEADAVKKAIDAGIVGMRGGRGR